MLHTRTSRVLGGTTVAASLVAGGLAFGLAPASAAIPGVTITGVQKPIIASETANQVITVTGTGFSEETFSKVNITGCGATSSTDTVLADLTYIVASPTSMLIKTNAFCAVGADRVITVTDAAGVETAVSNPTLAAQKLSFVAPVNLAATNPVVSLATADLEVEDQVKTAPITGGTYIKVTAGTNKFAATGVTATLGGIAMTDIKIGPNGDHMTGRVGAHVAGAVALSVTSAGVQKNFTVTQTGFEYKGIPLSVLPAFGPSNGGGTVKITGSGFDPALTAVTFNCGAAPVPATIATGTGIINSATSLTVTVPKWVDSAVASASVSEGPCTVKASTTKDGVTVNSIIGGGSTYTYISQV